jgi:biopolymer transport protein ExbD
MPKIKTPRSSPSLDMTPMVDLAFLLVTFFMLTATMRAPEPVIVDTPSTISDVLLPKNTLLVTIDTAGRVFLNYEGKEVRMEMLKSINTQYPDVKFSPEQIEKFGSMQSFGVPFKELPAYINAKTEERKVLDDASKGIPLDSVGIAPSELAYWVNFCRIEEFRVRKANNDDPKKPRMNELRVALKADGKAAYKKIDAVIAIFKKQDVYQFNLITDLEADPNNPPPAAH